MDRHAGGIGRRLAGAGHGLLACCYHDHWLKAGDDALYRAKRAGKNRIYAH